MDAGGWRGGKAEGEFLSCLPCESAEQMQGGDREITLYREWRSGHSGSSRDTAIVSEVSGPSDGDSSR